jgi:hypothetical protein
MRFSGPGFSSCSEEKSNDYTSLTYAEGILTRFLHFGHLPLLPAYLAGTFILWPQLQENLIKTGLSTLTGSFLACPVQNKKSQSKKLLQYLLSTTS